MNLAYPLHLSRVVHLAALGAITLLKLSQINTGVVYGEIFLLYMIFILFIK